MTLGTIPRIVAATPDLEGAQLVRGPMNTWLTDAMRPRIASGDSTRRMTLRTTTLTPSTRPATNSAPRERRKLVERPNAIMDTPKLRDAGQEDADRRGGAAGCAR